MKLICLATAAFGLAVLGAARGEAAAPPKPTLPAADAPWPEAQFELFKLAPGKQEAFIRRIARDDEVSHAGGQPPMQIYVHEDGADWDVLILKPFRDKKPTAEQQAAMTAKRKALGIETGPAYFVASRELIASHTDTRTNGPITAGQWLARLDAWRAEHPAAQ